MILELDFIFIDKKYALIKVLKHPLDLRIGQLIVFHLDKHLICFHGFMSLFISQFDLEVLVIDSNDQVENDADDVAWHELRIKVLSEAIGFVNDPQQQNGMV